MDPATADLPEGPRSAAARVTGGRDGSSAAVTSAAAAGLEAKLTSPLAVGYIPRLPITTSRFGEQLYFNFFYDVEWMLRDDAIRLPLQFVMGPAAHAEWSVEARTPAEAMFIAKQIQWFWSNAVNAVQEEGYPFGFCPGEMTYDVHDGLMVQSDFQTFNPRDSDPLVLDGKMVGVQIQNTAEGVTKLWSHREDIPNKAFWYIHLGKRGQRRGQSQFWAAYRPWLRLTGRDGGEELIDLGFYKLGVPPTIVDHPNQPYTAAPGKGQPYAVNGFTHTRDEARAIAETAKSGAGIAVSSEQMNGVRKWDYRVLATGINGSQLIEYIEYLERKCSKGVGVPPELFQAAQTGSGYSGREIPLEGFMTAQQRPVNDMTKFWLKQIGQPLNRWNHGSDAWAQVVPKPLLGSYKKNVGDTPAGPGPGVALGAMPPQPGIQATMSAGYHMPRSSHLLVRSTGEVYDMHATSVSVPDMAFLATDGEGDFADRLATMSMAELEALAAQDDV